MKLVLTCEHAGNKIPAQYQQIFSPHRDLLNSHRGYDPGALDLFHELSSIADFKELQLESRLLVELNRSLQHPQLYSEISKKFSSEEKEQILQKYYFPFRNKVTHHIKQYIKEGEKIFHLSVHSFTPVLDGEVRKADIGLLYDPGRPEEKELCRLLKHKIHVVKPDLHVRFNYPYLGTADGFTTFLRREYRSSYIGVELEVNQKFVQNEKIDPSLKKALHAVVAQVL